MEENRPITPSEQPDVEAFPEAAADNDENAAAPLDEAGDELTALLGEPPVRLPVIITMQPEPEPQPQSERQPEPVPQPAADPEFDAYLSIVKLLIGGAVEGTAELVKRLERWETELREAEEPPQTDQTESNNDVARYLLVGMTLSTADTLRRQVFKFARATDVFWRMTGSATRPLVNGRLTSPVARPIDQAIENMAIRGQNLVNSWVELGRAQEPSARRLARKSFIEIVDEFISHLAENEELADLVQEQSVGLASEAVDEIRSRTVSADALAESIVRRILRRPPRGELPPPPDGIRQTLDEAAAKTTRRP